MAIARLLLGLSLLLPFTAEAFCGFYVSKADTKLYNHASKVVLVREDGKTVLTMVNDYEGDPKEFAMVIPVPTFLEKDQIHVTENKIVEHLDAYSAPRLVEYFDDDPCNRVYLQRAPMMEMADMAGGAPEAKARTKSLGVTVEASYTVGEYDILILSAKESDGLATWLKENGYKTPDGAERVLESYIKQGTRFFVAKVNLEEQAKQGGTYLRPLQIAFESPKFMLPIRLGTVNAKGSQELFIFTLTRKGRVEATNYRTVKIPSDMTIPLFVKDKFGQFYTDMFNQAVQREGMKTLFLEYAWDMNWCDPCAADPLSNDELRELGAFWIQPPADPAINQPFTGSGQEVFLTRLHVRYDAAHFPEDLMFQITENTENFQGRYVMQHPWTGDSQCAEATQYRASLPGRFEAEAQMLSRITGWEIGNIREQMQQTGQSFKPANSDAPPPGGKERWYHKLWKEKE
jgi:hypothetical protein